MAGRPPETADHEILREVALSPGPIATAPDLADRLGMGVSGMNKRLKKLVESGYLKRKEVGASAVVYWLTEEGKEYLANQTA
jgi:DNA-binding MarR family transcriptional regulator